MSYEPSMGWWKIDPATGKALPETYSALSRPDFRLLNAVPGVDNDPEAHYLGDAPWDFAESFVEEVRQVLGDSPGFPHRAAEQFLKTGAVPKSFGLKATAAKKLQAAVKRFWGEIDDLYREEWGREATDAETRWIRAHASEDLIKPPRARKLAAKSSRGAAVDLTLSNDNDVVGLHLYKRAGKQGGFIGIPAKILTAALDQPTFKLFAQVVYSGSPVDRILESSLHGERRRLKITGPMGVGPEGFVAEKDFRQALNTILGVRAEPQKRRATTPRKSPAAKPRRK